MSVLRSLSVASVTARGASWRVQGRDRTGHLRGVTFQDRADADAFGELVDRLGWDAARATLGGEPVVRVAPLSLNSLRLLVIESDSSDWYLVDRWDVNCSRAVYGPDISVAVDWERDGAATRAAVEEGTEYPCYPGLTRDRYAARVLFHGQPIVKTPLLVVKQTYRKQDEYFFVPHARSYRRRWQADALDFWLARAINSVSWGYGFESYMERSGVRPTED